jgi:hypothetical protein
MVSAVRYLMLHRALRNAGDFLIRKRAHELVRAARPNAELVEADAWRPLEDQLGADDLASLDAIVVCGGPGIQRRMHPDVYPLRPLQRLDRPVVLLSIGSYFFPADAASIDAQRLDEPTRGFLRHLVDGGGVISVRDELSAALLRRSEIDAVTMSGDVAWYRPAVDDAQPDPKSPIDRIAFTAPANPMFLADGLDLLRGLHAAYPAARITLVAHRDPQPIFDAEVARLGGESVNIAGSSDGFRIYDEVSLHVGYRLHAHLYSLSGRRISYLLAEDSRGVGALQVLGSLGVDPFDRPSGLPRRLLWGHLPRWGNPRRALTREIGQLASRLTRFGDPSAEVVAQIDADRAAGYDRHASAFETITRTRASMDAILEHLP